MRKSKERNEAAAASDIWDCGSPLYDSFELVSVSHQIERHLMKLPSLGGPNRQTTRIGHRSDVTISDSTSNDGRDKDRSSLRKRLREFLGSRFWKRRKVWTKEGQGVAFARSR
ncbi:hypothetical protein ES332_A07G161800v1 [Gossypium tomentosum]|uniref:Uncharacterized protein n=1 Tax=Gossypium tomentosum TaxID=34277 RepID=A0A5D2PVZ7_GOSTO|nr:hypothetical protein ES332_A07G161800v1 [Gossypium tomentosum]